MALGCAHQCCEIVTVLVGSYVAEELQVFLIPTTNVLYYNTLNDVIFNLHSK